jgi:hypothetical protein
MDSNRSILIAAALVFVLIIPYTAPAQPGSAAPPPCTPWCGGDSTVWPWMYPPVPISFPLQIGGCQFNNPPTCCTITAWYRFRRVCYVPADQFQFEILRFSWDRDCHAGPTGGFDPVPMLRLITYGLLQTNPMNFPPLASDSAGPQCMANYTVQAASCWNNSGMLALTCDSDTGGYACCKGGYQVCRVKDPVTGLYYRQVTWLGQTTVVNACIPPCMPSCGAFDEDGGRARRKDASPGLAADPVPEPAGAVAAAR